MTGFAPLPQLYVSAEAAQGLRAEAARRLRWVMAPAQMRDLALLMEGALLPLRGYPGPDAGGPMLEVPAGFAGDLEPGEDIALCAPGGEVLAMLSVTDRWGGDPVRLGGRVKGLAPVPGQDAELTPNALRARFRAAGCSRVVAELGAEAVTLRPDRGAEVALAVAGPPAVRAAFARNHGATHLALAGDAGLDAVAAEVGLEPLG